MKNTNALPLEVIKAAKKYGFIMACNYTVFNETAYNYESEQRARAKYGLPPTKFGAKKTKIKSLIK